MDSFICDCCILVCMSGVEWKSRYTELLRVLKVQLKRKFSEFAETAKEYILYVIDWKLWAKRLCVYASFLLVIILICNYLFNHFNLYHTDADNARYMLSAIVQAQAAIVAIVITLTLIAVQLTASTYSPRVIDVFKKNPDMWILLVVYVMSMLYGLFVLKIMKEGGDGAVSPDIIWYFGCISFSFEHFVSFAYWLEVFTLVTLVPYMQNIIDLLKPENIIEKLSKNITRENVLEFVESEEKQKEDRTQPTKDDPMQPIVDIIHGSVMKYDIATTGSGLKAITEKAIEVVCSDYEKADGGRKISEYFCVHLIRIGKLTVSIGDGESVTEVLKSLEFFGKSTAEKGLEVATSRAAWSLRDVGKAAAEKGLEGAAWSAAVSLRNVGKSSVEEEFKVAAWNVAEYLGDVGKAAAEKGLEVAARQAAWSLEDVGKIAAEKGFKGTTAQAAHSLIAVGTTATENRLEDVARKAAKSLAVLTISSEEIVKVEIQNYELQLQHDRESFRKFMQVYEEKVEELRAKKV